MADKSPDSFREDGVKRLNRLPLLIVAGVGVTVALGLGYAVQQRAAAQRTKANTSAEPDLKHNVMDASSGANSLAQGMPASGVLPETPQPSGQKPQPPVPNLQAGVVAAAAPARAAFNPTPAAPAARNPQAEDWLVRYRQQQQRKWQLYEAALTAPTGATAPANQSARGSSADYDFPAGSNSGQAQAERAALQAAAMQAAMGATDPNMQDSKKAFAEEQRTAGYLMEMKLPPVSPYQISMGTVIPAVMVTGVNSDLPGEMIAQVSQDVYDTATGKHLLIPQGTKLFGVYDSQVSYGQSRVLVAWTRLTFPDASALALGGMSGADQAGYAGFKDRVNNHYVRLFGSALLASAIGAAPLLAMPDDGNAMVTSGREQATQQFATEMAATGRAVAQKNINIQPTIEIRPGYRFVVMVKKDIAFPTPYVR